MMVKVDCTKRLGEAVQIGEWMSSGAIIPAIHYHNIQNREHPLVQAWRRLGFRYVPMECLVGFGGDSNEWHFKLSRDHAGKLMIDFAPWDKCLHAAYFLLDSEPMICFSYTPKELSKHPTDVEYAECMPRDLNELQDFCQRVVEHTIQWGDEHIKPGATRGLYYSPVDEPDWQGYRNQPDEPQTVAKANSVLYYAACYRGIKAADPTAKVGGPRHGQWQHPVPDPEKYIAAFSFRDWLEEFKKYIDANPDVGADFFSWQDYHYYFEGPNLSDGAEAVRGYLRELGFSNAEEIPLLLCGGTGCGTWSDDYSNSEKPKYEMASFTVRNIIREFKAGSKGRKFGRADYWIYYRKKNVQSPHIYHTALIWMDDAVNPPTLEFTAIYAVFEMIKLMMQEDRTGAQIVQVEVPEPLAAMASFASDPAVLITNYSDQVQDVVIKLTLPADYGKAKSLTQLRACIQQIDKNHSDDGKGLEPEANCWRPQPIAIESDPGRKGKCVQLSLHGSEAIAPWGTVLIRLLPAE